MMEMPKWLLAAILFLVAVLGAGCARLAQQRGHVSLKLAEAFASGALINAALVHILAEASRDLDEMGRHLHEAEEGEESYPWGAFLCGVGILLTHVMETLAECLLNSQLQPIKEREKDGSRYTEARSMQIGRAHV
eukprot:TRINITY_DN118350_c0_g1_i1.p1 TRINITY_DN118350_c0_g1~~TRINITY_DN118350_c0_g1_i1.p1  ORF type:complete len:135 (+),score=29.53 TRINITY_DN118350_c0_g1_i1:112-516(+)